MGSYDGTKKITKFFIGEKQIKSIYNGPNAVYSKDAPGPVVDPILNNNDWATIRAVCEAGEAANYWSVGDTKTDVGTDGNTRTFRIVDMQGLYSKHVVFEQVELEPDGYAWNSSANSQYRNSQMRNTHLPAIMAKYSSELQTNLTDTTYKVATSGSNGTILDLTDKLFLPAMKELFGNASNSRPEEADVLSHYQYYATNTATSYKIKTKIGENSPSDWWSRSAFNGSDDNVCIIRNIGNANISYVSNSKGVAPCFAF